MSTEENGQRRGCNFNYQVRWFYSKGAALVLLWTLLMAVAGRSFYTLLTPSKGYLSSQTTRISMAIGILTVVAAPVSGWLADAKLGNYRVIKAGFILLFFASILNSLILLMFYNTSLRDKYPVSVYTVSIVIVASLYWIGMAISSMNLVQLGLDQMPDASANNVTSFIAWVAISIFTGVWGSDIIVNMSYSCLNEDFHSQVTQTWTILPVLFMSLILISNYILGPKWLTIEPQSPQALKNIFRVLKFAAKHKAPINRSAFTYWEEDIPSRMDLGKSRYSGPFTTEQIEDVKTFFRIVTVSIPMYIITFTTGLRIKESYYKQLTFPGFTNCTTTTLYTFTSYPWWCVILSLLVYELLVYPLIKHRLPSSLKKIGIVSFAVLLRNTAFLALSILDYFLYSEDTSSWLTIINSVLYGLLTVWMIIPSLEFVCAQSPYNMRGLLSGYMIFIYLTSQCSAALVVTMLYGHCTSSYCPIITMSLAFLLSIIAFLLHCFLAHWYRRRVRDDIFTPHRLVEEVYDRYLSSIPNQ